MQSFIDTDVMTVTGQTVMDNIKTHRFIPSMNGLSDPGKSPFGYEGGLH